MSHTAYRISQDSIVTLPFANTGKNNWILFFLALAAGSGVLMTDASAHTTYLVMAVATLVMLLSLYEIFLKSRTKIIFNIPKRTIYKAFFGVLPVRLLYFKDAFLLRNTECQGDFYGVSHKRNRYGKVWQISPGFTNDSERHFFEKEILGHIEKALICNS